MSLISYNIKCRVPGESKAHEWLNWLQSEHITQVLKSGAQNAEIIRFDDDGKPGVLFQITYYFKDREAINKYLNDFAPQLRQDGAEKFSPDDGFLYERTVGEVIFTQ